MIIFPQTQRTVLTEIAFRVQACKSRRAHKFMVPTDESILYAILQRRTMDIVEHIERFFKRNLLFIPVSISMFSYARTA